MEATRSIIVGTGLIVLDVTIDAECGEVMRLSAGGTCGNVLCVLARLGWFAVPICTLGRDKAGDLLKEDLLNSGVALTLVHQSDHVTTSVVINRIHTSGDRPHHEFLLHCPHCDALIFRFTPVTSGYVPSAVLQPFLPLSCFFADRLSPASVSLAKEARNTGALVVFEPSVVDTTDLFKEMVEYSHVVKYSYDRLLAPLLLMEWSHPILEIQTLGAAGLRYRLHAFSSQTYEWCFLPSPKASVIVDSSGAGDWCTAGIIHILSAKMAAGREFSDMAAEIEHGLTFGQALAAWSCRYVGARGAMCATTKAQMWADLATLLDVYRPQAKPFIIQSPSLKDLLPIICPNCAGQAPSF